MAVGINLMELLRLRGAARELLESIVDWAIMREMPPGPGGHQPRRWQARRPPAACRRPPGFFSRLGGDPEREVFD